jgi:hypothetical protein
VRVLGILSGFRLSQLEHDNPDITVRPHREFEALWPREQS